MMQHKYVPHLNLVVLFKGQLSSDEDLTSNFKQFFHLDGLEARRLLKNEYFTILAHGETSNLVGLNDQASLGWIHNLYKVYGKGRKILLLACDTGVFLSRDVAMMLKQQVIAPLGFATFDFTTGDITIEGDKRWNKCDADGKMVQSTSSILKASFLK